MNNQINNSNIYDKSLIKCYINLLYNLSSLLKNKLYYISGDLLNGYLIKNSFIPKKNLNYELILLFDENELIDLLINNYELIYNKENKQITDYFNKQDVKINIKFEENKNIQLLKINLFNSENFVFYIKKEDEINKNNYINNDIKNNLIYNYIDYFNLIFKKYYIVNYNNKKNIFINLFKDNSYLINDLIIKFDNIIEYNIININIDLYLLLQNVDNLILNLNFNYFNKTLELLKKNNELTFNKIKDKINIIFINNYDDFDNDLFIKNINNLLNDLSYLKLIIINKNKLYYYNKNINNLLLNIFNEFDLIQIK